MTNAGFACPFLKTRRARLLCGLLLFFDLPRVLLAEPSGGDTTAFKQYVERVESRLVEQHRSSGGFLAAEGTDRRAAEARMRAGEFVVERMEAPATPDESLLHHWRGTAFAPGAKAADFERLMQEFNAYPKRFAPQVVEAKALTPAGDHMQAWMRVRQHHVITVVMDTTYDVTFGRLDAAHGYSVSQSTRVQEIEGAGTKSEHVLSGKDEHGFLWRLNTYWSYEERDGGLYLQIESVSLTRSIPRGLGWAVRPYVESIPRESLDFTLRSACAAIRK